MSLVSRYKLDGNALDSVGSNDGTSYGNTYGSGVFGRCANFTTNDYVSVGDLSGTKSFSFWLKPTVDIVANSTGAPVMDFDGGYYNSLYLGKFTSGIAHEMVLLATIGVANNYFYWTSAVVGTSTFSRDKFHHFVFVWDLVNAKYRLYYNGADCGLANGIVGSPIELVFTDVNFGKRHTSFFNGSIDDIRIYNHALTEPEIEQLYFNGLPTGRAHPNLLAHYRFESTQLNLGIDASGNGHHGTVYGATPGIGQFGGGADFDGVNDYIDLGWIGLDNGGGDLTVSAYLKFTDSGVTRYAVDIGADYFGIYTDSGKVAGFIRSSGVFKSIVSTTTFNDGIYHSVVFVKTNTNLYLYIDGVLNNSNSNGGIIPINAPYGAIGRRIFYATNYFRGSLDEVKVFNKAYDNLIDVNLLRIGQNPR